MADIQFLDNVPSIARTGGPNAPAPEVQEFMDALKENPGKWAEFPLERKTKPKMPADFSVAGRGGKWYASFTGEAAATDADEVEDITTA